MNKLEERDTGEFQSWPFHPVVPLLALLLVAGFVLYGTGAYGVWYVIRGTGFIAFALLTLSVVAGLLISNRVVPAGRSRVDTYEVHTLLTLLALAFTSVHGVALLLDQYVGFSTTQILVPFTSSYRPFAVGVGILSAYIALMVYGSFWARRFIGYKAWRALHFASFLAFLMAAIHGILSGTDTQTWWAFGIYAIALLSVGGLTARRLAQRAPARMQTTVRTKVPA